MKLRLTWWSIAIGLVLLAMILSLLGIIHIDVIGLFWIVVTIACVWTIMKIFFSGKRA